MKILVFLLTFFAMLACMGGCIPIGVRGSTIAAAQSPSCVTPSQIDAPLRPGAGAATTDDHLAQAQPRCA
jgi:hypothetical protein